MLVRHLPYTVAFINGILMHMLYGEISDSFKNQRVHTHTHTHTHTQTGLVWGFQEGNLKFHEIFGWVSRTQEWICNITVLLNWIRKPKIMWIQGYGVMGCDTVESCR